MPKSIKKLLNICILLTTVLARQASAETYATENPWRETLLTSPKKFHESIMDTRPRSPWIAAGLSCTVPVILGFTSVNTFIHYNISMDDQTAMMNNGNASLYSWMPSVALGELYAGDPWRALFASLAASGVTAVTLALVNQLTRASNCADPVAGCPPIARREDWLAFSGSISLLSMLGAYDAYMTTVRKNEERSSAQ